MPKGHFAFLSVRDQNLSKISFCRDIKIISYARSKKPSLWLLIWNIPMYCTMVSKMLREPIRSGAETGLWWYFSTTLQFCYDFSLECCRNRTLTITCNNATFILIHTILHYKINKFSWLEHSDSDFGTLLHCWSIKRLQFFFLIEISFIFLFIEIDWFKSKLMYVHFRNESTESAPFSWEMPSAKHSHQFQAHHFCYIIFRNLILTSQCNSCR